MSTVEESLEEISKALDRIGFDYMNRESGPGCLEAIAMALAGQGFQTPVGEAIDSAANALGEIAIAINDLAHAVSKIGEKRDA